MKKAQNRSILYLSLKMKIVLTALHPIPEFFNQTTSSIPFYILSFISKDRDQKYAHRFCSSQPYQPSWL